jgi:hypothetical protein
MIELEAQTRYDIRSPLRKNEVYLFISRGGHMGKYEKIFDDLSYQTRTEGLWNIITRLRNLSSALRS